MEPTLYRAQASRIYLWFVVNRVTYGESLPLFVWNQLTLNHYSYEIEIAAIPVARF